MVVNSVWLSGLVAQAPRQVVKKSTWDLILEADPVVQLVMVLLALSSIVCWAIIFSKLRTLSRARSRTARFLDVFWKSASLSEAYKLTKDLFGSPLVTLFRLGYGELTKLHQMDQTARDLGGKRQAALAGLDNISRALNRARGSESTRLGRAITFLATTGNAAPFVGLFGTVWGIMVSFQDIYTQGSASLATVAPGISEALVATAAGLAAAIPAVIAFNFFLRRIQVLEAEMDSFTADFLNIIERDLLRRASAPSARS